MTALSFEMDSGCNRPFLCRCEYTERMSTDVLGEMDKAPEHEGSRALSFISVTRTGILGPVDSSVSADLVKISVRSNGLRDPCVGFKSPKIDHGRCFFAKNNGQA
jgi:hypothetical protein